MLFKMIKDDIAWKTAMIKCKIRKVKDNDWQVCRNCKANKYCQKLAEYKKDAAENVVKDILPQMKFTRNAILVEQKDIAIFSSKIKTRWI